MSVSQVQKLLRKRIDSKQINKETAPSEKDVQNLAQAVINNFSKLGELSSALNVSSVELLRMLVSPKSFPDNDLLCLFNPAHENCPKKKSEDTKTR